MATKQFEKINVYESGQAVVVVGEGDGMFNNGEVSASWYVSPRIWLINRAIIPVKDRGHGLGTQLLQKLLATLAGKPEFFRVEVSPGGYGGDPQQQANFYTKNGFRPYDNEPGTYYWQKEIADVKDEASQEVHADSPDVGREDQQTPFPVL